MAWGLGNRYRHMQHVEGGGGGLGANPRLEVELFTFFVAGARDKDIFVGKSKIVGLGA